MKVIAFRWAESGSLRGRAGIVAAVPVSATAITDLTVAAAPTVATAAPPAAAIPATTMAAPATTS